MRKLGVPLSVVFVALLALGVGLSPLQAQEAPDSTAAGAELEVIATGLTNPRGMTFGPDGSLYIAEAGTGGDGACVAGPDNSENCYGDTGAVTKVTFDQAGIPDNQQRIVSGLSSLGAKDTGDSATGPSDVVVTDTGDLYVLMGLGADPAVRAPGGPFGADGINFGQLVSVDSQGAWTNMVDISGYEATNNPDGAQVDSNPFAMIKQDGNFLVVDAGGNSLLKVTDVGSESRAAAAAAIGTVAVFPVRMVEFPPGSGQMIPMDAVPTAVEVGPDGAYYVSQLTGFPFPVGGANIWRVVPGEAPTVFASGFTNVLDLAFDPDGSLYVLEMAKNSLLVDPPVGQITRITPYGARTVIASDGLVAPVDMELGPDHALYVANFGPVAALGQVVRIPLPQSTHTAVLQATRDNTLYENVDGMVSNGKGEHFFAGKTADEVIRRGLVGFDTTSLPAGSMITSATVKLHMSKSTAGDTDVTLHAVTKDWGEGTSDAVGEEGAGALATTGDATWLHTFYDTDLWTAPGGDFAPTASATTIVGGIDSYEWASTGLVSDVQACIVAATSNCSWLVMGDESQGSTAKRFDTLENAEADNRPQLTVEYVMPLPSNAAFLPVVSK